MAGRKKLMLGQRGTRKKKVKDVPKGDIDALIQKIVDDGATKFATELMSLEGKEYVDRFSNLLEYIKPKLSRQDVVNEGTADIHINLISASNPNVSLLVPQKEKVEDVFLLDGGDDD